MQRRLRSDLRRLQYALGKLKFYHLFVIFISNDYFKTCVGDEEPVRQQNCEKMNPGKPLCEQNACKSVVSSESKCASPLRCTSEGYFPSENIIYCLKIPFLLRISIVDPTDCSQYYYCEDASLSSKVYQCPPGYSYNSVTTLCRRSGCQTINCTENADHYVALPDNNIYFAYCLDDLGVSLPIMFRCPNDYLNHTFFDENTQSCEFQCPYEGRFVDFRDPTAYYECLRDVVASTDLITVYIVVSHQQCLEGLIFDGYRSTCRRPYSWENSGILN